MIVSGWFNFIVTSLLFLAMVLVFIHYYRPKSRENRERDELPKYRMLDDDDDDHAR
jgi:hypothetical protein